MPAISDMAVAIAPIAGGMALGAAAGYLKGPDVRKKIKQDMDLLEQLPTEEVERRAKLQRRIDSRIDDLIATVDRYQRGAADSYRGGFRDILLLTCAIVFAAVWWSVDHHESGWLQMFVVLMLILVWALVGYAFSDLRKFLLSFRQRRD